MKNKLKSILTAALIAFAIAIPVTATFTACKTTSSPAFNTLYTVEHSAQAAFDAYLAGVVKGKISTNGVPAVSKAYNKFQASFLVALDAVQFSTNAIAPTSLVIEG